MAKALAEGDSHGYGRARTDAVVDMGYNKFQPCYNLFIKALGGKINTDKLWYEVPIRKPYSTKDLIMTYRVAQRY